MKRTASPSRHNGPQSGFSMVEVMICVAVILILCAIVWINLNRARTSAHEAVAAANLTTINTAQAAYNLSCPDRGYADRLSKLGPPPVGTPAGCGALGILNGPLACQIEPCIQSGYQYQIVGTSGDPATNFVVAATPLLSADSQAQVMCSDRSGVLQGDHSSCEVPVAGLQTKN